MFLMTKKKLSDMALSNLKLKILIRFVTQVMLM